MVDGVCLLGLTRRHHQARSKDHGTMAETRYTSLGLRDYTGWSRSEAGLEAFGGSPSICLWRNQAPQTVVHLHQYQVRGQIRMLSDCPFSFFGRCSVNEPEMLDPGYTWEPHTSPSQRV